EWPRGSYISSVRRSSRLAMKYSRFCAMVSPGTTPTPPVMTRVGMPSVCESTACRTRRLRIRRPPVRVREGGPHGRVLLGGERRARWAARAAVPAGEVHRELDGLDERWFGVPPQQRVQRPVRRDGRPEIAGGRRPPQLDALGRQGVGYPSDPPDRARDGE